MKTIFTALALFIGTTFSYAQSLVLHNNDGSKRIFDITQIDSITFDQSQLFGDDYEVTATDLNNTTWKIVSMPGMGPEDEIYEKYYSHGLLFIYSKLGYAKLGQWSITEGVLLSDRTGTTQTASQLKMSASKDTLYSTAENAVLVKVDANPVCGNWIVLGRVHDNNKLEFRCSSMMGFYPDGTTKNFHINEDADVGEAVDSMTYTYNNGTLTWNDGQNSTPSQVEVINMGTEFIRNYNGENYFYIPFSSERSATLFQQTMMLNTWEGYSYDGTMSGDNVKFLYDDAQDKTVSGKVYAYGHDIGVKIEESWTDGNSVNIGGHDYLITFANNRMVLNGDNGVYVLTKKSRLHNFQSVWSVDRYKSKLYDFNIPNTIYVSVNPNNTFCLWGMLESGDFVGVIDEIPFSFTEKYDKTTREFNTEWDFEMLGETLHGKMSTNIDVNGLHMTLDGDSTTLVMTRVMENRGIKEVPDENNPNASPSADKVRMIIGTWDPRQSAGKIISSSNSAINDRPLTSYRWFDENYAIGHITFFGDEYVGMTLVNPDSANSKKVIMGRYTCQSTTLTAIPEIATYMTTVFGVPSSTNLDVYNINITLADSRTMNFVLVGVGKRMAIVTRKAQYIDYMRRNNFDENLITTYENQADEILFYTMFNKP